MWPGKGAIYTECGLDLVESLVQLSLMGLAILRYPVSKLSAVRACTSPTKASL